MQTNLTYQQIALLEVNRLLVDLVDDVLCLALNVIDLSESGETFRLQKVRAVAPLPRRVEHLGSWLDRACFGISALRSC